MANPAQSEVPLSPVPLRPASSASHPLPPLPTPLTALLGREREVAAVQDLLHRDDVHLVTLTGPGGVGKSRVAIRAASALDAAFPDGIVLIRLAPLTNPEAVLSTIASVLGVRELGERTTLETLQTHLRPRRLLLLLDSFEPVLAAAPALAELLRACPAVKALVTSRARLRLRGERLFPILPLAMPEAADDDPERLLASPAVALFVQRAQDVLPDFALTPENAATIAEITRRLEGLPLAIELAAARLDLLSPAAMLARLERRLPLLTGGAFDLPERQRTMQAAIAWSYDLLPPHLRQLSRRLGVFRGSFSLSAAAACAALDERTALEQLATLVEQSLVRRDELSESTPAAISPRFIMLDTIREYAQDGLVESGEEDRVRQRHAHFFCELAEQAAGDEPGRHLTSAFMRLDAEHDQLLDAEHDQLREALRWTIANEPVTGLRLAAALVRFLYVRCPVGESRDWFERALAVSPWPSVERAKVLYGAGAAASYQGDHDLAVAYLDEALQLARSYDEPVVIADTLLMLGTEAEDRGDYARARAYLSEALDFFLEAGDRSAATLTQYHLGVVAYGDGDHPGACIILEAARNLAAEHGDDLIETAAIWYLALIAIDAGDHVAAALALLQCLEAGPALAQPEGVSRTLSILAVLASERDEPLLVARFFGAATAVADEIGYVVALPERARFERAREVARGMLGAETFDASLAAGCALTVGEAVEEAMTFARCVIDGDVPHTTSTPIAAPRDLVSASALTARELEVLRLLADGRTNPEIAGALYISLGTVRAHVSRILDKLDAHTRTEAAANARRFGLL